MVQMMTKDKTEEYYHALLDKNIDYAFSKIISASPTKFNQHHIILKASWIETKLGVMIAISDETSLYLLEFLDKKGLEREVEMLSLKIKSPIISGTTHAIESIKAELKYYFEGKLQDFKTPIHLLGTEFQKAAWEELMSIPYGITRSYLEQAKALGKDKAYRAVANANSYNKLAIIIPCHRIINSNGNLGGYRGGIIRKKWLIEHETKYYNITKESS